MLRPIYDKLAKLWYKLVTLKSSPRKIALGFALGIFLSFTPTLGFQTALALGLATLLRVNPISAAAGVYLTNIFTAWPLYALCYNVGSWVAGVEPHLGPLVPQTHAGWGLFAHFTKLGLKWIAVEFLGAIIVGGISAVPAYFLALFAIVRYRTARLNRRIQRVRARMAQGVSPAQRTPPPTGDTPQ